MMCLGVSSPWISTPLWREHSVQLTLLSPEWLPHWTKTVGLSLQPWMLLSHKTNSSHLNSI